MASAFWTAVVPPAIGGMLLALLIETCLEPRPVLPWKRSLPALAIHAGLWLLAYAAALALFHRPYFAAALVLAFLLAVALVSNAKRRSLREPFIYQDFEYFADALRHPRLYLPFLGWTRAVTIVAVSALVWYAGILIEPPLGHRMRPGEWAAGTAALAAVGAVLLWAGARGGLRAVLDPDADLRNLGLAASLWHYAAAELRVAEVSPIGGFPIPMGARKGDPPHLIVVQSESFFDVRRLYPGIRDELLREFDALKSSAALHGRLEVHAWGANTVRTEFAFLSGLAPESLGVHRFQPYRRFARRPLPAIAGCLKELGYRTVCVHPYPASFYGRDRVFPLLGFDEFIDIRGFGGDERQGPYVGDIAVARRIDALLEASDRPLFVFAITMENHGPLALERPLPGEEARFYSNAPPWERDALTVYLRHLGNADRMAGMLRDRLATLPRAAWLCWYGDHVPILPEVYDAAGFADGRTDYFVWGNRANPQASAARDLRVEQLGRALLEQAGLLPKSNEKE